MPATGTAAGFIAAITILLSNRIVYLNLYKGYNKNPWINSFAIAFAAIGGTSFRDSDLTDTNFTGAILKVTDFRNAILTHTIFWEAKGLDYIRPGKSYLQYAEIRKLFLTKLGRYKKFNRQDLEGINLQGVDLTNSSFIRANLSKANLQGATLSGACIEDWNINSQTNLEDVECTHVYLKDDDDKERRPHNPNKNFAPGEFAKLVQKALETVDLIFADGIDWKAFLESFQELQTQYDDITVQAIEKKSGDAFVIRLEVTAEVNKAEIESKAKELYEIKLNALEAKYHEKLQEAELQAKNEQIAIYRECSADLKNIINMLGNKSIQHIVTNIAKSESMSESHKSKYDLSNSQVSGIVDTAQGGSHQTFNQHNYAPEQKQNLAQVAAEIQQLLYHLSQTNSTTTEEVTELIHKEIKRNPTLKARLKGALKAGGIEALKAIFNHPLFSIPVETVKGWLEAE